MNNNNNSMLFLRLAEGGQMTPEMMQMAQQSGQLPQMDMGAGLNDIQKMNMRQQSHYGNSMFRYGGVPMAAGGQQEQTDQAFLSPDKKYSGRVQDFLKQLKSKAMSAVQDEMFNTATAYDKEAAAIDMQNQMRYGGMYAPGGATFGQQPTFDMSGVNAADAWLKAGQDKKVDLTQNVANVASAATGLKGFFNNSGANKFNDNPYNTSYIKKGFITDVATGDRDRIRMAPGGEPKFKFYENTPNPVNNAMQNIMRGVPGAQQFNLDATRQQLANNGIIVPTSITPNASASPTLAKTTKKKKQEAPKLTPEEEAKAKVKAEQEARIAEEVKKAQEAKDGKKTEETKTEDKTADKTEDKKEGAKTETKTETKTTTDVGDGLDYWRMLADPNSDRTGGMYQLDKNGNPIPAAFYDPNMRISNMTADYRVPVSNLFRRKEKDRAGVMKRASFDFTYSPQSQNPGVPQNPNAPQNPAAAPGNTPAPAGKPTWANQFFPQPAEKLQGPGYAGGPWSVDVQGGLSDAEGFSRSPEADANFKQQIADWRPGMLKPGIPKGLGFNIGPDNFTAPAAGGATQGMLPSSIAQMPGAQNIIPFAPVGMPQVPTPVPLPQAPLSGRQERQQIRQEGRNTRKTMKQEAEEKAYLDMQNAINQRNAGVQQQAYGGALNKFVRGGVDPTVGIDKPWVPETVTKHIDYKFGKENPFLVPGIMAGLDTVAGGLADRDADRLIDRSRDKFSADQVYTTMPQTSGSRGDYDDKGNFRPDNQVPVERSGYNFQSNYAARGGEMSEGDEMYLDEETINAILAAGGQVEYLD